MLSFVKYLDNFGAVLLLLAILLPFGNCTNAVVDTFDSSNVISEKQAKEELLAIAFAKCIETGGDSLKLLEAYIFVDKQFSKSSGTTSQRERITYKKTEAENCRNNLLLYQVEKCDFKPFDFWNAVLDKQLCKLDPTSFAQF